MANPNVSHDPIIDRLFEVLAQSYGRGWLDLWADIPIAGVKAEWSRSLHGVEPEVIRLALDSMKAEGRAFPPNLPQFVAICRQMARKGPTRLTLTAPRTDPPENVFQRLKAQLKQ